MKQKNLLAAALATAACTSYALGVAFLLTTGNPIAFLIGLGAFLALAATAATLNPTI